MSFTPSKGAIVTVSRDRGQLRMADEGTKAGNDKPASALAELARRCGIVTSYVDARGKRRKSGGAVQRALLAAMGFEAASEEDALRTLNRLDRSASTRTLPPVTVHSTRGPPAVELTLPSHVERITWRVKLEGGRTLERRVDVGKLEVLTRRGAEGAHYTRVRLLLPGRFPFGYHMMSVQPGGARMPLIIAPAKCWLPPAITSGARLWGLAAQLYLLRSNRDWGIGDFGDLRKLIDMVRPLGADAVGLNPLHGMFSDDPEHASPYSPASRLLLNILNIDVPRLARQLKHGEVRRLIASPAFRAKLSQCHVARHVRYTDVAAVKLQVLRMLFDAVSMKRRSSAWLAYKKFARSSSPAARRAWLFLALRAHFSAQKSELADWRRWPQEFRMPESPAVKRFAAAHAGQVAFQGWLQYVADVQLGDAAAAAKTMRIGLYRDLAVGADPAGAETWSNQRSVVSAAQVGAPPDIYNPKGQDWGLPPFNPRTLREQGYRGFVDLLRANMRHAGGLRIDHVMALLQLYWIPTGNAPKDGAYVQYPIDDLIGILALESHRQRCLVVGEDLGTVPGGFRERMAAANILSYRVLFFERDTEGYLSPDRYPELALAVVSSHDLPTLHAWWDASDLELKSRLELFPSPQDECVAHAERERDKAQLRQALAHEGLVGEALDTRGLYPAAHAFLARSRCALTMAQIDDITDETDPVNVPTTSSEYPNWRRRLSLTLEQIAKSPRLTRLAKILSAERADRGDESRYRTSGSPPWAAR